MVYRKDLLENAGIKPPKTLDEMIAAVKKLTIRTMACTASRCAATRLGRQCLALDALFQGLWRQVVRWRHAGLRFGSRRKATETYLELFKYSAPGTKTGSWDESTGAFLSGQVALLVESTPLSGVAVDPKTSKVVGKVGFLPPPAPLTGGGYGHGLAIAAKANKDDAAKKCAGLFVAWATSKENEKRRLDAHQFGELNRTSILSSDEFDDIFGADLGQALADTAKVTAVNFWQDPVAEPRRPLGHHRRGTRHRHPHRHQGRARRARDLCERAGEEEIEPSSRRGARSAALPQCRDLRAAGLLPNEEIMPTRSRRKRG